MKREYLNRIVNTLRKKPWVLFVILAVQNLISYGVDLWLHIIYNIRPLTLLNNKVIVDSGIQGFKSSSMNLMYHYTYWIAPFLEYGILTILMSLLVKLIAFILIYKITLLLIKHQDYSLIIAVFFLMSPSYAMHGVVMNGLWGFPMIFDASLSALATFGGILFLLKNRFIIAGLLFALSIHLHGLYGINALAWIFFGQIWLLMCRNSRAQWKGFFIGLIPILVSLAYIAFFTMGNEEISYVPVHVSEWYRYMYSIDPGDASMLWTLENAGYSLLPLFSLGSYWAWNCKKKGLAEYFMLGSAVFFLIVMTFELLHRYGIFFGVFSEYFLITEFRRGIWIPSFFALIIIVQNFSRLKKHIAKDLFPVIAAAGVTVYLAPSITTVLVFLLMLSYFTKNSFYIILSTVSLIMGIIHIDGNHFTLMTQLKSGTLLSCSLVMSVFVVWKWKQVVAREVVILISGFVLVVYLLVNLAGGNFIRSVSALTSQGVYSKTNHKHLINIYAKGYDQKVAKFMQSHDLNEESNIKIQLPPNSFTYQDKIFYGHSLLFSRYDLGPPLFSKSAYEQTMQNISSLIGENKLKEFLSKEGFYSKSSLLGFIEETYNRLTSNHLIETLEKSGLKYYLIKKERKDLKNALVLIGDIFYVYDITLMQKEKQ
jgi:hypothetical protein